MYLYHCVILHNLFRVVCHVFCGIWRSKVWFLMGTPNFFCVPCSWQDKKHLSLFLYQAQNLPSLLFLSINVVFLTNVYISGIPVYSCLIIFKFIVCNIHQELYILNNKKKSKSRGIKIIIELNSYTNQITVGSSSRKYELVVFQHVT